MRIPLLLTCLWCSLLLPTKTKTMKTTGKVGAKFVTANVSPNFSYENAIDMPEETCGVFAVPHELAHDARYGFFLYEKSNPENFVSDIGVQPKGGYADIEVIEEESPAVTTLTQPVSKKEAKKREKEKEMKAKKGEFEDGTKMTPTQKEFFEEGDAGLQGIQVVVVVEEFFLETCEEGGRRR